MAKKSEVTVKQFLKEMCFAENDVIFLYQHNGRGDEEYEVKDIPQKLLNKKLIKVQPHFGGVKHNYSSYRLIYSK